jgi:hypothetical protein
MSAPPASVGAGVVVKNRVLVIIAAGLIVLGGATAFFYVSGPPRVEPARPEPPPVVTPTPARKPDPTPVPSPAVAPRAGAAESSPAATPEASPTTGTLIIESDVPETSVFLDRVYLGNAPVTARDVPPGPHRVNLSASGYDGYVDTIDVVPGTRTISAKFKEIRLDATLAVVHKHAMGSCTGTLHATPQGLTYESSNKDDAFTAPLTGLETFTMDYLAKTLRLKVKGGKSYNFTDPDGNVNRLYLFHQDVDKVRQRLIGR